MKTWKESGLNETCVYKQGGMRFGIRESRHVFMRATLVSAPAIS